MMARDNGESSTSLTFMKWHGHCRNPLAPACDGLWNHWCRLNENFRSSWSVGPTGRAARTPWLRMNMKRGFFEPPKCRPQDLQLWLSRQLLWRIMSWISWEGLEYFVSNYFS